MSLEMPHNAITGVAPANPIVELHELLGVRIVEVIRTGGEDDQGLRKWFLTFAHRPGVRFSYRSYEFRDPAHLNRLAQMWGRDHRARPLTRADGRRVLRLLHEHYEQHGPPDGVRLRVVKADITTSTSTTEKENGS